MDPIVIIVMGVSGSGKSTVAKRLADALNATFIDGDDLHPKTNLAKMAAGVPLTDEDRYPWLQKIARTVAEHEHQQISAVIVCSALKRAYRDIIRQAGKRCFFLFLDGNKTLLIQRMQSREGHFMKVDMLDSQLATLERPEKDETDVIGIPITLTPEDIVRETIKRLPS